MAGTDSADAPNVTVSEAMIEARIFSLLATRQEGATICPSEVARSLAGPEGPWRDLMTQIRDVARGLVKEHRLSVTRRGEPVDSNEPGGPIRLGRAIP